MRCYPAFAEALKHVGKHPQVFARLWVSGAPPDKTRKIPEPAQNFALAAIGPAHKMIKAELGQIKQARPRHQLALLTIKLAWRAIQNGDDIGHMRVG